MNYLFLAVFWLVCIVLIFQENHRKKRRIALIAAKRLKKEGNVRMLEMLKELIGKECTVHSIDGNVEWGVLEKVEGNAAAIRNKNGTMVAVNVDYVTAVEEVKRKKVKK